MRRGTALFRLCPSAASCSPLCLSILHTPLLAFGFSLMTHSPELLLLYKSRRCVSGSRQCSPAENTQEILIKSGHNVLQMREIKKSGYYNNGLDLYGAFLDTQSASWVPGSIHSHTAILVVVNYDTWPLWPPPQTYSSHTHSHEARWVKCLAQGHNDHGTSGRGGDRTADPPNVDWPALPPETWLHINHNSFWWCSLFINLKRIFSCNWWIVLPTENLEHKLTYLNVLVCFTSRQRFSGMECH